MEMFTWVVSSWQRPHAICLQLCCLAHRRVLFSSGARATMAGVQIARRHGFAILASCQAAGIKIVYSNGPSSTKPDAKMCTCFGPASKQPQSKSFIRFGPGFKQPDSKMRTRLGLGSKQPEPKTRPRSGPGSHSHPPSFQTAGPKNAHSFLA